MDKIILANFKQNPETLNKAVKYFEKFKNNLKQIRYVYTLFTVPSVFLHPLYKEFKSKRVLFGLQDISEINYCCDAIGKITSSQAKSAGASFSFVSHPSLEFNPKTIANKIKNNNSNGLFSVFAFGEKQRDENGEHFIEIKKQLKLVLSNLKKEEVKSILFLYEPYWISETDKDFISKYGEESFITTILYAKKIIAQEANMAQKDIYMIYAGNINKDNAEKYLKTRSVNGIGVGKSSLNIKDFIEIVKIWNKK